MWPYLHSDGEHIESKRMCDRTGNEMEESFVFEITP
jgi:hypothetical protein